MTPTDGKHLMSLSKEEHDDTTGRKRVATWLPGNTVSYEDASFVTGSSPAVLDVYTDLGREAHDGYIRCDGSGNIKVELSSDGTNYGGQHTLKNGELLGISGLTVRKIRLTWVTDSAYRALVV